MAFAKGRAFVILNRMAETNPEAKKLLNNLNSLSQEDFDGQFGKLLGKGGASKEGDTAPKDAKSSKAPEGKEQAPKGSKEPKEGKVVANKDFDPNKEGVQSIFGTEEENAKSKDKKVFDTPEQVMGKEPKGKQYKGLEGEKALKQANEDFAGYGKELDEKTWEEGSPGFEKATKGRNAALDYIESNNQKGTANNPMTSAKEGIKPVRKGDDALMTYIKNEVDYNVKQGKTPEETIAKWKEMTKDDKNTLEAVERYEKEYLSKGDVAPEQKTDAFGTSKAVGGGIGGGQKDLLGKKGDLADPNRPDLIAEMEDEVDGQLTLTGTDFENPEDLALVFTTLKDRFKDDPQRLAALEQLEKRNPSDATKGSASNPMTSPLEGIKPIAPEQQIKDNNKNYLGKKRFMTEPNSEVDREINAVMQGSESNSERLAGIAALQDKYEGNKVNMAALQKIADELEAEDEANFEAPASSNEEYFKLDDEFETMVNNDGTNSMQVVNQLKEKYKGDAAKQQALNKLEGKEKFKAATKEYLENNKQTNPLWAKAGMTGNQKLWDAERVRDAMYDFINEEATIEDALAQARNVFQGSKGSEEFIDFLEQQVLSGAKPVEAPKSTDPLKQGKVGFVAFYKGKKYEVFGDNKLQARDKLAKALNVKKAYEINLEPAEVDGEEVKTTPDF